MILVGAISASMATLFSLIALGVFFNHDKTIQISVIAGYLILVLVVISIVITVIRWLQVPNLINTDKRKLRIALVTLGTICVVIALLCTVAIFIFAKKLNAGSNKFTAGLNQKETELTAAVGENLNWYNQTCADDPEGEACSSCQLCASKEACDKCVEKPVACGRCDCDAERSGMLCKYLKSDLSISDVGNVTGNNSTNDSSEPSFLDRLGESLGEPAEDSPCRNITSMLGIGVELKQRLCQLYESTNSWHCSYEGGEVPDKLRCVAMAMAESASTKNLTAGMLIGCLIGHLVNICVAIWCTQGSSSKKDCGYKLQNDVNMDGEKFVDEN